MRTLILIGLLLSPAGLHAHISGTEQKEEQPEKNKSKHGFRVQFKNNPSLRFDKLLQVDLKSKWQVDFRNFHPSIASPPPDDDRVQLTRARFALKGKVTKYFEFETERELRGTFGERHPRHPWRDVYIDFGPARFLQVKVGKFKVPFGREQLTPADKLDFIERSPGTEVLTPGRDKGVMLHGKFLKDSRLDYQFGVFRNDGENADIEGLPSSQRTYAARISGTPFRLIPQLPATIRTVQWGIAATSGEMFEGLNNLHAPAFSKVTHLPRVYVKGRRQRLGVEALWSDGPFSVTSEYIYVSEQRTQQSVRAQDLPDLISDGGYVTAAWTALGKMKDKGGPPRNPFLTGNGFGAVELAVRFDVLRYRSDTHTGSASRSPRAPNVLPNICRAWTFGPTWYLNKFVKIQANAERQRIEDIELGRVSGRNLFWSGIVRLQFAM